MFFALSRLLTTHLFLWPYSHALNFFSDVRKLTSLKVCQNLEKLCWEDPSADCSTALCERSDKSWENLCHGNQMHVRDVHAYDQWRKSVTKKSYFPATLWLKSIAGNDVCRLAFIRIFMPSSLDLMITRESTVATNRIYCVLSIVCWVWDRVRHSRMLCWWQKTILARRFDALRHHQLANCNGNKLDSYWYRRTRWGFGVKGGGGMSTVQRCYVCWVYHVCRK